MGKIRLRFALLHVPSRRTSAFSRSHGFGSARSGKNGYLAFEDFCLISPYCEIKQYDIDICATAEEQARTSFDDIYNILENPAQTKKLKRFFYWNKEVITGRKNKSKIKYRTNNAKSKDGLRSGKVDFDEVHAYENYDNIKVFTTALGKNHTRGGHTSQQTATYVTAFWTI